MECLIYNMINISIIIALYVVMMLIMSVWHYVAGRDVSSSDSSKIIAMFYAWPVVFVAYLASCSYFWPGFTSACDYHDPFDRVDYVYSISIDPPCCSEDVYK